MTENGNDEGSMPPRLLSFRVRNFRSFVDAQADIEPGVTVFVGSNDVGKTTLLNALELYGRIGAEGFAQVARKSELAGAEEKAVFSARWVEPDAGQEYLHEMVCDPKEPQERISWEDGECTWLPRRRVLHCAEREYEARGLKRFTSLGAVSVADWQTETDVPDELITRLSVALGFRTPTPYLFQPWSLSLRVPLDIDRVYGDGYGWLIWLADIINRRDDSIGELEERLQALFPHFRRVRVVEERWEVTRHTSGMEDRVLQVHDGPEPDEAKFLERFAEERSRRNALFEVECPTRDGLLADEWVPARAMSSGLLLAMAYLTTAMSSQPGSLLALEEPENGLNGQISHAMMEMFLEVVSERRHQLLMTTHNPFWLDLVPLEAVRVVTRDESGSHVSADAENLRRIREDGLHLSEVMGWGGPEQLLEKRGDGS